MYQIFVSIEFLFSANKIYQMFLSVYSKRIEYSLDRRCILIILLNNCNSVIKLITRHSSTKLFYSVYNVYHWTVIDCVRSGSEKDERASSPCKHKTTKMTNIKQQYLSISKIDDLNMAGELMNIQSSKYHCSTSKFLKKKNWKIHQTNVIEWNFILSSIYTLSANAFLRKLKHSSYSFVQLVRTLSDTDAFTNISATSHKKVWLCKSGITLISGLIARIINHSNENNVNFENKIYKIRCQNSVVPMVYGCHYHLNIWTICPCDIHNEKWNVC